MLRCCRHVGQLRPTASGDLRCPGRTLFTPSTLPPKGSSITSVTSVRVMDIHPKVLCFLNRKCVGRVEEIIESSLPLQIIPAENCLPLLWCQMVCQNLFEVEQLSFSMSSPNVSQDRVFVSTTIPSLVVLLLQLYGMPYFGCPPPILGIPTSTSSRDNRDREHSPLWPNVSVFL